MCGTRFGVTCRLPEDKGHRFSVKNFEFLSIYTAFRPGGHYFCCWQCHVSKIFFPILDSFALIAELYKNTNSTAQFTLVY